MQCRCVVLSAGANNHQHFIGFLASLLVMCAYVVWGGAQYYAAECPAGGANATLLDTTLEWAHCNAWLMWVMVNAAFHLFWVTVLTACQLYLVVCLGMTTNEQLNRGRYRHFQARGGRSPFSRGPLHNCADFFGCGVCGLTPRPRDWAAAPPDDDLLPPDDDAPLADTAPMLPADNHYV